MPTQPLRALTVGRQKTRLRGSRHTNPRYPTWPRISTSRTSSSREPTNNLSWVGLLRGTWPDVGMTLAFAVCAGDATLEVLEVMDIFWRVRTRAAPTEVLIAAAK